MERRQQPKEEEIVTNQGRDIILVLIVGTASGSFPQGLLERAETHDYGIGAHELLGRPRRASAKMEVSAYPDVSRYTCCESLPADSQSPRPGRDWALGSNDSRVVA